MDELTTEEQQALTIELEHQGNRRAKTDAINAAGWTINHYCLLLNRALANPSTLLNHPELVRRRQAFHEIRARERGRELEPKSGKQNPGNGR